ncbi:MAG: winged helix DNA-binding protein [Thaumarchaeota archaeon]|nr:winged helix DNA-binding protein [Nitrososphaerota archaeon]
MLVEIPDPEVILGVILAFLVGLVGLYVFYKARPFIKSRNEMIDVSQSERLEYYERQLIDMKIRLDAIEIQGIEQKSDDPNLELKQFLEKLAKNESHETQVVDVNHSEVVPEEPISTPSVSSSDYTSPIGHVLHLITNKAMTSRDIQITLKRSREHTSRLMKKLFEDGFVERNTETKPYTYSITEKGKTKVDEIQTNPIIT